MFEFEYEILDPFGAVGRAQVKKDGLYWQISAECPVKCERIVRVYAINAGISVNLGVLMPEDGALRLNRRIAQEVFTFTPDTVLSTKKTEANQDGWRPFSGTVEGTKITGALRRGNALAIACDGKASFALMAHFACFHIGTIDAQPYWMAELDESGEKLLNAVEFGVDNGAKCDKISTVS